MYDISDSTLTATSGESCISGTVTLVQKGATAAEEVEPTVEHAAVINLLPSGDPLSTDIGCLVDKATHNTQTTEDWGLILEICDMVNETVYGPGDTVKAIKYKLKNTHNQKEIQYTISVLDSCLKNCSKSFHSLVMTSGVLVDIGDTLKNLIPDMAIMEVLNTLITTLKETFKGTSEEQEMNRVIQRFRNIASHTVNPYLSVISDAGPVQSTPEQDIKLLSAMLKDPNTDLNLLKDVKDRCSKHQAQVLELFEGDHDEGRTIQLLEINDELNHVLELYNRYDKKSRSIKTRTAMAAAEPAKVSSGVPPPIKPRRTLADPQPAKASSGIKPPIKKRTTLANPQPANVSSGVKPPIKKRTALATPQPTKVPSGIPPTDADGVDMFRTALESTAGHTQQGKKDMNTKLR